MTAMSEMTQIITGWLWRFFPLVWLDVIVARLIGWSLAVLEDEDHRAWLMQDRKNCAWFGGWLALSEERLDELIAMKAMGRLRRFYPGRRRPYRHHSAPAVASFEEAVARFTRLVLRHGEADRLAERRALKLQRLFAEAELRLEAIHHPVATTTTIFESGRSATIFRTARPTRRRRFSVSTRTRRFSSSTARIRPSPSAPRPDAASMSETHSHPHPQSAPARTRDRAQCLLPFKHPSPDSLPASHRAPAGRCA